MSEEPFPNPCDFIGSGVFSSSYVNMPVTVRGCFDGVLGFWWVVAEVADEGWAQIMGGTRESRVMADHYSGVVGRFWLFFASKGNGVRSFRAPSPLKWDVAGLDQGLVLDQLILTSTNCWTPINTEAPLIAGAMGRAIGPVFAGVQQSLGCAMAGEGMDVMIGTRGFSYGDSPVPGWYVLNYPAAEPIISDPDAYEKNLSMTILVRAPGSFDSL
jgi:hypothetical protein